MTLSEHLEELRWRLLKSVIAFIVVFIATLFFQNQLIDFFVLPHKWAMDSLKMPSKFYAGKYQAPFMAYLKLSLIVAVFFSFPVFLYQMWRFVSAGLYQNERKFILSFLPISILLFILGSLFGFFILLQNGLYFLALLSRPDIVSLDYFISDYLDLVTLLTVITGILFEIPVVMLLLTKIGLATPQTFSKFRRLAIVIILIVSAVVTPSTDPITQLILAVPLYFLFELGIILSKLRGHQNAKTASV